MNQLALPLSGRGREVLVADFIAYRNPSCGQCRGLGYVVVNDQARPCGGGKCSLKKFRVANHNKLVVEGDRLFWRAGDAPPLTQ